MATRAVSHYYNINYTRCYCHNDTVNGLIIQVGIYYKMFVRNFILIVGSGPGDRQNIPIVSYYTLINSRWIYNHNRGNEYTMEIYTEFLEQVIGNNRLNIAHAVDITWEP